MEHILRVRIDSDSVHLFTFAVKLTVSA